MSIQLFSLLPWWKKLTFRLCNFVFVSMSVLAWHICLVCPAFVVHVHVCHCPLHQWASRRPPVSVPVWMCCLVWSGSLDVIDMLWTCCLGYSCSVCSQWSHITYGPVALFRTGHQQYRGLPTTASPHPAWTLPWWTLPGWERRVFCFFLRLYGIICVSFHLLSVMAMFTGEPPREHCYIVSMKNGPLAHMLSYHLVCVHF